MIANEDAMKQDLNLTVKAETDNDILHEYKDFHSLTKDDDLEIEDDSNSISHEYDGNSCESEQDHKESAIKISFKKNRQKIRIGTAQAKKDGLKVVYKAD